MPSPSFIVTRANVRLHTSLFFPISLIAVVLLSVSSSAAQDAASAKAFLNSAFRLYDTGGKGVDYSLHYYHSSLLALINADLKAAKGNGIPVAGTDTFCNCQEWEGFWVLKMDVSVQARGRAEAVVSFTLYAPKNRTEDDVRRYKYTLVPERGEWRIYDVLYLSDQYADKSLRKALAEDIKTLAHKSN